MRHVLIWCSVGAAMSDRITLKQFEEAADDDDVDDDNVTHNASSLSGAANQQSSVRQHMCVT